MIKHWDSVIKALDGNGDLMISLEFNPYDTIFLRPDYLLDLFTNKKVIHLGCTDHIEIIQTKLNAGNYLHKLITYVSEKCLGIDINKQALDYIRNNGIKNIIYGDVTLPNIKEIEEDHYDYILLGEMLEHVENPVEFLKKIVDNYVDYFDQFVITVPNSFGLPFLSDAINNGRETINSDHKYWFTPYTLMKVVHQAGLYIYDLQMCLYENSRNLVNTQRDLLKSKPLLLDTIIVRCGINKEYL
jgi:hypothetical protein